MLAVYDFDDYKKWAKAKMETLPQGGRGEYKRIAEYLKVNSTLVSQIFSGPKDLTLDQGFLICEYYGLDPLETEYIMLLIQITRSGSYNHKLFLQKKKSEILERAKDLSKRLPESQFLSPENQAIYYSQWYYSAVRILFSLDHVKTFEDLCAHLDLPRDLLGKVTAFLVQVCLLKKVKDEYFLTNLRTYLPNDAIMIGRHHANWRYKTADKAPHISKRELMYTCPLSISKKDADKVHSLLLNCIAEINKIVDPSEPQEFFCFNIDFVKVK